MSLDLPILKKGSFYIIMDNGESFILEDRTKRGLETKDTSMDGNLGILVDRGMIHDMDGIGHWVAIRRFFPKDRFVLYDVLQHANIMEKKYAQMRELTCPD